LRQKVIDKVKITERFPEIVWKDCKFTKEEYMTKQKKEINAFKKVWKKEFRAFPREIVILKLWRNKRGAIFVDEISIIQNETFREKNTEISI
jgi:hypothetical protein